MVTKPVWALLFIISFLVNIAFAQFTFYLIDNFEGGKAEKWWKFGEVKIDPVKNSDSQAKDQVAQSCGDYALKISGKTNDWYVGGIGTYIGTDADSYSRLQMDICGNHKSGGTLKIELFDDDNQNFNLEQDPEKSFAPIYDDKWVAEVNLLGPGFTRISIPFPAFRDANPGVGDGQWNPSQKDGSGGLLQLQFVFITEKQKGEVDLKIDNVLLTY